MSSWSGKRGRSQFVPFLFSCSLSQFRGPDYHRVSNTQAKLRLGVNLIKLLLEFWHQSCNVIFPPKTAKIKKVKPTKHAQKKVVPSCKVSDQTDENWERILSWPFLMFSFFQECKVQVSYWFQTLNIYTRKFFIKLTPALATIIHIVTSIEFF